MKQPFISLIVLFSMFALSQCTFDNAKDYYSDLYNDSIVDCGDTVDVSFTAEIFPIIADNCISCHNDVTTYAGRNYDTYEGIMEVVNNGKILKVINHDPGYPQMPYKQDKLPQCYIDKIEAWVRQGSKDN